MMATNRWYQPECRPGSTWRRFSVCEVGDLPAVLDTVVGDLEAANISLKVQFAIRLSLEEAAVNALVHGHGGQASLPIRICCCLTSKHWMAEVVDHGRGFNVSRVLAECSARQGIGLMRRYMNWVRYNYLGNRIVLCKYLMPRWDKETRRQGEE
jgi:anti-sigma regulatory factor (Ser/Thr protein kinase)